jgi:hypothetical protein
MAFPLSCGILQEDEVKAQLLVSADLPQSWARIDAFEGSAYARHLVPAAVKGSFAIANVYVAR